MKLVTDRPKALTGSFVLMGIVMDSGKNYACLFDSSNGKTYIEEMYWTMGVHGNEATAKLREVEDDKEWQTTYNFVTTKTTVFSPKKLRQVLAVAGQRSVKQIDEVINNDQFPYAKRKIDPNLAHRITIPKA